MTNFWAHGEPDRTKISVTRVCERALESLLVRLIRVA
jgi:hypothetical protein